MAIDRCRMLKLCEELPHEKCKIGSRWNDKFRRCLPVAGRPAGTIPKTVSARIAHARAKPADPEVMRKAEIQRRALARALA